MNQIHTNYLTRQQREEISQKYLGNGIR